MFTLTESWILFWKRLFSITGRSSRSEYWWIALLLYMVSYGLQLTVQFYMIAFYDSYAYYGDNDLLDMLPLLLLVIALLLLAITCFILTICLNVRRLHDRNLSGWWYLLALIPIVGSIFMFVVAVLPSVHYTTRFGADPTANPPAHFDFYSKKLYLHFGAFGLNTDMPGYPQYPDYGQYLMRQQHMQEEWMRQQKSTAQYNPNQDYAFDPSASQNQNNFSPDQHQNASSYAFDPSAPQHQSNLSSNQNQTTQYAFNQSLSQVNNPSVFNQSSSQVNNQTAFNPNISPVNNQFYQPYTGNANVQFNNPSQQVKPNQYGLSQNQYGLNPNQAVFNQSPFQQPNQFSNRMFPNVQFPHGQFPNTPFSNQQLPHGQFPQNPFNGQVTPTQNPNYPFAAGQFNAQGHVSPFSSTQIQANQFAKMQGPTNQFANAQGQFSNVQGRVNPFPNYQSQDQHFASGRSPNAQAQVNPFFNGQFSNSQAQLNRDNQAHLNNDNQPSEPKANNLDMHAERRINGVASNDLQNLSTPTSSNPEFNLRTGFDEPSSLSSTELKANQSENEHKSSSKS